VVNIKFDKKELKHIVISIILLGFIFGFDDKMPAFVLSNWISNFIFIALIVAFSLIFHEMAHKFIASRNNAITKYSLWSIDRYGLGRSSKLPAKFWGFTVNNIYIGAFIALFLAIVSKGMFIFAAIGQTIIEPDKIKGIGSKYKLLANFEIASIALVGPLASLLLALIFNILGFKQGVEVNSLLAIYSMLPLPKLDGINILFNSRFFYIFSFIFILSGIILLQNASSLVSLIISLLIAIIITLIFFYKSHQ